MCGIFGEMFQSQRSGWKVVEDRFQPVMEQRQPMFHARIAASLAHRFVKPVVGGCGAELRDISRAETTDGFGNELKFCYRHQIEPAQLLFASLSFRIKGADGFDCIAEEIEPHRHIHAGRIKIENASPDRVVARLAYGGRSDETVKLQPV